MSWNIHPGEILLKEFIEPMGLNANQLAHLLDVPTRGYSLKVSPLLWNNRKILDESARFL